MAKSHWQKSANSQRADYENLDRIRNLDHAEQNIEQDSVDETRPLILCKEHDYALCSFHSFRHQVRNFLGRKKSQTKTDKNCSVQNLRFITKGGRRNTVARNSPRTLRTYSKTVFQTLVNLRWHYQFLFVSFSFITTWLLFGCLWWALERTANVYYGLNCITDVDDFYSAFLFSIETQTTIGYGSHYLRNSCKVGIWILLLQIVSGVLMQSLIVAIVISKFTHPKWKKRNVLFSDKLCVFEDRGSKIVAFRIADITNGELSMPEAHVRVYLIHSLHHHNQSSVDNQNGGSKRGEGCMAMEELDIGYNKGHDRILLLVPWVVEHVVTPKSPLFNKSKEEIEEGVFEIVVILEGSVEESGSVTQCMKSYTGEDILWGYNFDTMISKKGRKFQIDYSKLNSCSTTPRTTMTANDHHVMNNNNEETNCIFTETDAFSDNEKEFMSSYEPRKRSFVHASYN